MKNSTEVPQKKLKMIISLLGIQRKKIKNNSLKRYMNPNVHVSLFTISKIGKQFKRPLIHQWIKEMWYTVEYYIVMKNNKVLPFGTTWMDLEYYDKWNNSEKDKYFIVSLIMDSKNKQKKSWYKEQMDGCQIGEGDREMGKSWRILRGTNLQLYSKSWQYNIQLKENGQ